MYLEKSVLSVDRRLPECQENSYSQTSTWPMVTVSEYGTLCLDYGLVAALVSINREAGEKRNGTQRHKLCDRYDRLREKERERHYPLVTNEAFRRLYPIQRTKALSLVLCVSLYPSYSIAHYLNTVEVDVFIIYVNFVSITETALHSETPVTRAKVINILCAVL